MFTIWMQPSEVFTFIPLVKSGYPAERMFSGDKCIAVIFSDFRPELIFNGVLYDRSDFRRS